MNKSLPPTIITIPATKEEMVTTLTGWQSLITATEWSKAATIAAFVYLPGKGTLNGTQATADKVKSDLMTPDEFAALGIIGLRSKNTVRKYVRRWLATTRPIPKPGEQVDLSGLPPWDAAEVPTVITALDDDTFVAKVVEEMTPEQRNHVRREVNIQEMERSKERRKGEKTVERGAAEQMSAALNDVTSNIYIPLSNARRTLAQVNGRWVKFDGTIDPIRIEQLISGIRAEFGVLEMYAGVPFPTENEIPE